MARENTNKHYSLRKLKKGTASVAVALTVLGAGLVVNTNEVSADRVSRSMSRDDLLNRAQDLEAKKHALEHQNTKLSTENKTLQEQAEARQKELENQKVQNKALEEEAEKTKKIMKS